MMNKFSENTTIKYPILIIFYIYFSTFTYNLYTNSIIGLSEKRSFLCYCCFKLLLSFIL